MVPSGASGRTAAISSAELSGSVTFFAMTVTVSNLGGGSEVDSAGGAGGGGNDVAGDVETHLPLSSRANPSAHAQTPLLNLLFSGFVKFLQRMSTTTEKVTKCNNMLDF